MTLPFRRRHHDAEETHDRARALTSDELLAVLDPDDADWLGRHLAACTECRREHEAFTADRELLRSLRDKPIEPPRDLWAQTSAALDREAGKRQPIGTGAARRSATAGDRRTRAPWRGLSANAAAGALILLVIAGTALLPGLFSTLGQAPSGSPVAQGSVPAAPTPIAVAANPIVQGSTAADGSLEIMFTDIDAVCPRARPECVPPPGGGSVQTLGQLSAKASTMTISPDDHKVVFEAVGGTAREGKIYVVPVPTSGTEQTPPPTAATGSGSPEPATSAPGSPEPTPVATPVATPVGQMEIASGVTVVGEVAYSPDGRYLAFSAAPIDRSTGPDLYLWSAENSTAVAVTSDHETYFSAWLGSQILASHVAVPAEPAQPGNSSASAQPAATGTTGPGEGKPIEGHATSFLLDPSTLARTELTQQDVWMPVVDPSSRFVAYWSGTLRSKDGVTWELDSGQLVIDLWSTGAGTSVPGATGAGDASAAPEETAVPAVGPVGQPNPLVSGQVADFRAKFDPEGSRLAVWVGENLGEAVGRLHLLVIEPTGAVKSEEPLPGTPALRRFSIDVNRLAWVSPPGQDGQASSLQVLGWDGDTFGEIHSEPAQDLFILR
jgi:hypothetical protein